MAAPQLLLRGRTGIDRGDIAALGGLVADALGWGCERSQITDESACRM